MCYFVTRVRYETGDTAALHSVGIHSRVCQCDVRVGYHSSGRADKRALVSSALL